MQTFFDSLAILSLLGIFQAILLAGALVGLRRGSLSANRIMAAFLTTVAIGVGGLLLAYTKSVLSVPHLAQIHTPFGFLIAPLFFLYVRTIISGETAFRRSDFLHFIPAMILFVYLLPFYVQTGEEKFLYLSRALDDYPSEWRVRSFLVFSQQLIYLIFIYLLLRKTGNQPNPVPPARKPNFYLAKFFTFTFTVVWVIGFARLVVAHRLETNLLAPFVGCVFICGLVFKALQKPEVLGGGEEEKALKKYEKSTLKPDKTENYLEKIIRLMENEKLYLDRTLTLEKMARKLSIPPPHLSQLLNERLNQNFTDFVNYYRVEEFKKRFSDSHNDRYTIVAIAEASGFNSKSAFNAAFKKHTNLTPSEFKKTLPPRK